MPANPFSNAYSELLENRREAVTLLRQVPTEEQQLRNREQRRLANALFRGTVILLSSHLERYVEALVVEGIDAINAAGLDCDAIPEALRLVQIRDLVRVAQDAENWTKKARPLQVLTVDHSWLWNRELRGTLSGEPLINGFDNPFPARIRTLFRNLGINDVIGPAVGIGGSTDRGVLESKTKELVDKRNAIAHTGMTTDLTRSDVLTYLRCTRRLARGIDNVVGRELRRLTGDWPWVPAMGL